MADRTIKAGDTYPPIIGTLTDNGGAIDLTSAVSVVLRAKSTAGVISGTCDITDPENGVVSYLPEAGDTSTPGNYNMEWRIDWGQDAGKDRFQTAPSDTVEVLTILANQAAS